MPLLVILLGDEQPAIVLELSKSLILLIMALPKIIPQLLNFPPRLLALPLDGPDDFPGIDHEPLAGRQVPVGYIPEPEVDAFRDQPREHVADLAHRLLDEGDLALGVDGPGPVHPQLVVELVGLCLGLGLRPLELEVGCRSLSGQLVFKEGYLLFQDVLVRQLHVVRQARLCGTRPCARQRGVLVLAVCEIVAVVRYQLALLGV